jgi:superfamily II DNA or RNA helicase
MEEESSLEHLKDMVDRYEHPELFTFLDDHQMSLPFLKPKPDAGFRRNDVVCLRSDPSVIGVVVFADPASLKVSFGDREETFPAGTDLLERSDSRVLPLTWARRSVFGPFSRFRLKTLAFHLSLAHAYDKMQSLSNSRTQILAHQVECVHRVVNAVAPRFLIADEVGLGKTVEAGLIIKEFQLRHGYRRVLIVTPASLVLQWQQEMKEKFNEEFWILDGRTLGRLKGRLPDRILASLDFARQDRIQTLLAKQRWDVVVFDEAHRVRRDARVRTKAYSLAEGLSSRCHSLLLLSATPFGGKLEELYYLIRLLDASCLGSHHSFVEDYVHGGRKDLRDRLAPVLIRRRKSEVGGFTRRLAKTVSFDFTPEERELYDAATDYIREEYGKAMAGKNGLRSFVLTVYQKMLDSSSFALERTIERRVEWLEEILSTPGRLGKALLEEARHDKRLLREMADGEITEDLESIVARRLGAAESELKSELSRLKELFGLCKKIRTNKKAEALKGLVTELLKKDPVEKVIVFTQFDRTRQYLAGVLEEFGTVSFHGGLSREEKDEAIAAFRSSGVRILISTEAGGEGRNLQCSRVVVNYDLPWNPLKIEQRIGRIHRFGQTRDVLIFNFATRDTIAARVLEVLESKIDAFSASIGEIDTLLGYYEDEIDFDKAFMGFHLAPKEAVKDLDGQLEKARENFGYLENLTAARVLDFNLDAFYTATSRDRELDNGLIRQMAESASQADPMNLRILPASEPGLFRVDDHGREWIGSFDSRTALGRTDRDFFAFGHPFVDGLAGRLKESAFPGQTAEIRMKSPDNVSRIGVVFNFLVTLRSSRVWQYLMPVFMDIGRQIESEEEQQVADEFLKFEWTEPEPADRRLLSSLRTTDLTPLFNKALLLLEFKIKDRLDALRGGIEAQIGRQLPLLNNHYAKIFSELEELLAMQRSKEKIYGSQAARLLMARTEARIRRFRGQQEGEMERIRSARAVRSAYELINLAFVRMA